MGSAPELHGEVHQNLYLNDGDREVQALVTVDAVGEPSQAARADAAEVIVIDKSGSMGYPDEKAVKAVEAAGVAIDEIRDGVWFAVVAGSDQAQLLWPREPVLVRADDRTRAEAKVALRGMQVGGGTKIGQWLTLANRLLGQHPDAIRHAILLTDGHNRHESTEELAAAVAACEGTFTCDCRGVGADWSVGELRQIARALLGSVDVVAEPAGLAEDFRAMMAASMRKEVAEVGLQLWTPVGATVRLVKQTAPDPVDLTARRVPISDQVGHYPTGSWGTEQRDFHVSVEVSPGALGQEKLACGVSFVQLLADGGHQPLEQRFLRTRANGAQETHSEAMVCAIWTDDVAKSTVMNPYVAAATGQAEVEEAVRNGMEAYRAGDNAAAAGFLEAARRWADRAGNVDMVARLDDIVDPETGTFQLDRLTPEREIEIEIESTRQAPQRGADSGEP